MHELGVTFYIIRDVKEVAKENNVSKVAEVTIELGEVSGVIPEYLTDCWEWACKKEPIMVGCKLNIETMEAVTFCEDCRQEYSTLKYAKICPHCGSGNTYLLRGRDVSIKDITVTDAVAGESPAVDDGEGATEQMIASGIDMNDAPK